MKRVEFHSSAYSMEKFFTSSSQQGLSTDGCLHTSAQLSLFRFDNLGELPFRALFK